MNANKHKPLTKIPKKYDKDNSSNKGINNKVIVKIVQGKLIISS